jgi:hypothetical protein
MKFVVTVMVRDEVDIVALMIEHHLAQGADRIIATDNGSVDGTTEVLQRYADLGVLELHHDPVFRKQQFAVVTKMARRAFTDHGADWVINADADEFWVPRDRRLTLREALAATPTSLATFTVPVTNLVGPPALRGSGVDRLLWRDVRSPEQLQAVGIFAQPTPDSIHRGDPAVEVSQGNHYVTLTSTGEPDERYALEVLHLPWRSWQQYERRVLNTGRSYEANPDLQPSKNHHGMADYRRHLAGRLRYTYLLRLPLENELAGGAADAGFVYDPWLRDHLHALEGHALAPDLVAACLDASRDEPIEPAEHQRDAEVGRLIVDLEREREEALLPLRIRDEWLDVAQRTAGAVRRRTVRIVRRRTVGAIRRRLRPGVRTGVG